MKFIRRAHLFLGCFFTPLLLFYILTGWYQTVNLNRLKHPSEAESLLHAPGGGEQGVAGVRAEAGVGPHVFEAFAVGKKLRRHEVEHPENGEREEQRRLPVG